VADLVYPPVIAACKLWFRATNMHVVVSGTENIPRAGGAVLASNHVSYLDFIFVGLAGWKSHHRYVRFMAKESVFRHRVSGPLMRGMHHIPVDRDAGSASFRAALRALKAGELVGIFPEATISQSFTVKELKSGAVRLAQAARVPLVPVAVWGGQRMFTTNHPKALMSRGRHVFVQVGEPIDITRGEDADAVTATLRERLQSLLDQLQRMTPEQPSGEADAWWHPAHLGGSAPTPEQAKALEDAERAARRQGPGTTSG
jgi:1-acyl-sn-glycerol-3-phosphate acyltransferase